MFFLGSRRSGYEVTGIRIPRAIALRFAIWKQLAGVKNVRRLPGVRPVGRGRASRATARPAAWRTRPPHVVAQTIQDAQAFGARPAGADVPVSRPSR
ncbi:hypothetical protein [Streptomyces platensis]|uniref:hypothetical protein n=1 Tax=Streptomyces platensis TaxID=58346 RepID=UPI00117C6FC0|nr:hypothetical protein [Streptomyces platensis]